MAAKKKKTKLPKSVRKKIKEKMRARKAIQESRENLFERVKMRSVESGEELSLAPPNCQKMSEILFEYAEPLLDAAGDENEQKNAITLAIAIWNLSLCPEEMHPAKLKEIKKLINIPDESGDQPFAGNEVLDYLMKRKKLLFPDNNRVIVDFELIDTPEGLHLNVASVASKYP